MVFFFFRMWKLAPETELDPSSTTPAELEIIDLVLTGLTTREVAAQRGSSVRTVTTQLTEIFHKVGVHSQVELAAFITEDLLSLAVVLNARPTGLSKRQREVATAVAHGDSVKTIACELGITSSTASIALHSAMRKLGVKTRAELVARAHGLDSAAEWRAAIAKL